MSPITASIVVFGCIFGGALLGMFVYSLLPDKALNSESKDVVRLAMGLVATTVAVALGLLVASAKNFYDTQSAEVTQLAANFVLLDRILAHYGPEANDPRSELRTLLVHQSEFLGSSDRAPTHKREIIFDEIQGLSPKDDTQRSLKGQATNLAIQLGQTRWLMFEQRTVPIPRLLLGLLIFWLTVLFISFGLFAPRNVMVLIGLFIAALAVSGAILLILEMYHPEAGLIQVSDAPLRAAQAQIGIP
jgi:hypothetical protein